MENKDTVCDGCDNWERFKQKCHFFWEGKKVCSQFFSPGAIEPVYKEVKEKEEIEKIMALAREVMDN